MKLTWCGHSCFKLENGVTSVVFDPYAPGSVPGCVLPELTADAVLCSHGHGDHNYAAGVTITGKDPAFGLTQVDSFHDNVKGLMRGRNVISVVEMDGMRVCHLGDLGHELSDKQIAAIGRLDVLLIPVGGFFTIDGDTAAKIAARLDARIVVPMHYRGEDFGYGVIGTADAFLSHFDNVVRIDGNELEIISSSDRFTAVLAFTKP